MLVGSIGGTVDRAFAVFFAWVPALIGALDHKDPAVRHGAAVVLQQSRPVPAAAIPALIRALEDPEARVRLKAAEALVPVLQGLLDGA